MHDISTRAKWILWGGMLLTFFMAAVPSLVLIETFQDYWHFLSGFNPGSLRPLNVQYVPHRDPAPVPSTIRFVEFRVRAPKAKAVYLSGSFNQWDPQSLPLQRAPAGLWKLLIALLPGEYPYAFIIDGTWTLDPEASQNRVVAGREVCVKTVQ